MSTHRTVIGIACWWRVCRCLGSPQSILDPSNTKPAMACIIVGGILLCTYFIARAHKIDNERERRRRLYCKHGSFSGGTSLAEVPRDVGALP